MEKRTLGRTGRDVGVVGLGAWQLGADWGEVDESDALAVLRSAVDGGVTFIDTADVYGDGRSERLVGQVLKEAVSNGSGGLTVATKMGRRVEQVPANYNAGHLPRLERPVPAEPRRRHDRPGPAALPADAGLLDRCRVRRARHARGRGARIASYGVSVETCAEALTAIARPNVASVQIILNAFRLKPLDEVLPAAQKAGVGIIARVPLASGLLSGKYDENTTFGADDHRNYNRQGEAFDVGETFSGVDFTTGLEAVRRLLPAGPRRRNDGPVRPPLDPRPARRDRRHPRRPQPRPGGRQHRRPPASRHSRQSNWPPSSRSTTT